MDTIPEPEENQNQAALNECLNTMVDAFNEFHAQIKVLEKTQHDTAASIRARIDQKKIEEVRQTIANL